MIYLPATVQCVSKGRISRLCGWHRILKLSFRSLLMFLTFQFLCSLAVFVFAFFESQPLNGVYVKFASTEYPSARKKSTSKTAILKHKYPYFPSYPTQNTQQEERDITIFSTTRQQNSLGGGQPYLLSAQHYPQPIDTVQSLSLGRLQQSFIFMENWSPTKGDWMCQKTKSLKRLCSVIRL